jgi:hypothetical protein
VGKIRTGAGHVSPSHTARRRCSPSLASQPPQTQSTRTSSLASKLMASLAPVDPGLVAPDGHSDTSSALRQAFAMLQPATSMLASTSPDGGITSDGRDRSPGGTTPDKQAAVYDISARTVYMPGGTSLEAHSGLRRLRDDPRHVHVRNRGATPPQVYDLTFRERPFHGVRALRMRAIGEGDLHGRNGLLAHSYMLGPNGDSNGCVFFQGLRCILKGVPEW